MRLRVDGEMGGVEVAGESDALLRMLARGRFQSVFANEIAFKKLLGAVEFSSLRVNFTPILLTPVSSISASRRHRVQALSFLPA